MQALDTRRWVPLSEARWEDEISALARRVQNRRLCLLTGAGCSTESGIPDYRGEGTARRARNPILLKQFLARDEGRRRYWARSMIGWPRFRSARPNLAHLAAAALEQAGCLTGTITQNVDRLHTHAGTKKVVELHGALEEVLCLSCGKLEHRDALQERLQALNPHLVGEDYEMNPDGDAELPDAILTRFVVPMCRHCDGILKPRVVFFGEGVPKDTVERAWEVFEQAEALLVVGSSLTVFSGYRFVRRARQEGIPYYVLNIGATRADDHAALKVSAPAGPGLSKLQRLLAARETNTDLPAFAPRP